MFLAHFQLRRTNVRLMFPQQEEDREDFSSGRSATGPLGRDKSTLPCMWSARSGATSSTLPAEQRARSRRWAITSLYNLFTAPLPLYGPSSSLQPLFLTSRRQRYRVRGCRKCPIWGSISGARPRECARKRTHECFSKSSWRLHYEADQQQSQQLIITR